MQEEEKEWNNKTYYNWSDLNWLRDCLNHSLIKYKEVDVMNKILEGLVWLLGGSLITLALTLIVYFMMA